MPESSSSSATNQAPRYGRVLAVVRDGKVEPIGDAQHATSSAKAGAPEPTTAAPASPPTQDPRAEPTKPTASTIPARRKTTHKTVALDDLPKTPVTFKRTADHAPSEREEEASKNAKGPQFLHPNKLRFGATLYVLGKVSLYATILLTCYFAISGVRNPILMIALPGTALIFVLWAWIAAAGLRCRVCTMPFMRKQKCKMSPKAPKLPLASHQFTFAVHTLCHNNPRCPYCGTVNRLRK